MRKNFGILFVLLFPYLYFLGAFGIPFLWRTNAALGVVGAIVGCVVIPVGALILSARPSKRQRQLVSIGKKAPAVVLEIKDMRYMSGMSSDLVLRLKVEPQDEQSFESTSLEAFFSQISLPRVGDKITVYYDPVDKTTVAIA